MSDNKGQRLSFASDYIAGAHPEVLKKLCDTNMENLPGYGSDTYCTAAADRIRAACRCPEAEVYFLVGGTQTNQLVIDTMLDAYEGVIAADTGHVSLHEAGAIEFTGHKVIELPGSEGKLSAGTVRDCLTTFYGDGNHEHMVFPGMVYISFPTEYGTLYTKSELSKLHQVCMDYDIPLFIDGARLGYGLCGEGCDVELADLAGLCDVFYIGGTKMGALCGEAVVFPRKNAPSHFITRIKQHGALLAKGRLLGVQFDALFTDDLYMRIGRHAIEMAGELKRVFREAGYRFFLESPTNQQFIILSDERLRELSESVDFSFWEKYDEGHSVVRFATGWSTTSEDIRALRDLL